MDFGLTDEQREIQRTARELLSARATSERVREHGDNASVDEQQQYVPEPVKTAARPLNE